MSSYKDKNKAIHDKSDYRILFAGTTVEGEFTYEEHGGSVQPGLDYHVHYTDDKKEVFMLGGVHRPTSKIIVKSDNQSLFTRYGSLVLNSKGKYPENKISSPSKADYRIGRFKRYFVKDLTQTDGQVFEITKEDFDDQNILFQYIEFNWRISGKKDEVERHNNLVLTVVNQTMPGIARKLSTFEYYRPPKNSPESLEKKLSLLRNS